ncbi:MAG: tRNA (adenosine(37)-N6)-threonylcarbamoyltransferase complex ATPase subunit type 1 TsaE [Proteobacteria bacterium]|nr:tRNA (adenosine(37)-N6)-threonylcarbamoyltransferase complex ATPase subunit type 1 TsaE [Pseudomonadota bacterium]
MRKLTRSPDETFALAAQFSRRLKPGDVLALVGELGAGKTRFVQGLAAGLGVPEGVFVRSPSFALINEYRGGRMPLYHFDFYRLTRPSELADLGVEEYFSGDGATVVEWADRFPGSLPERARTISFGIVDENTREIVF